jgi:phage terminase small subunit
MSWCPAVAQHIRARLAAAAEGTIISVRARMVHLQMIVEADPSEIISIVGSNCRHCHGEGHAYQWRDEAELNRALDRYQRSLTGLRPLQAPDASGGFGFRGNGEPHSDCPACNGEGLARTQITPTSEWSPAARKLFKGAKQKANGEIEIIFHDQLQVAHQLNQMQGCYSDTRVNLNASFTPKSAAIPTVDELMSMLQRGS